MHTKRNKMLEDIKKIFFDNGYNLSILSEQASKWMSYLYSVLSFAPALQAVIRVQCSLADIYNCN